MSELDKLRELLGVDSVIRGTVQEVVGGVATVATRQGGATLRVVSGLAIGAGDRVEIQDKLITGKLRAADSLPVYEI